jgi:hypothetical protein
VPRFFAGFKFSVGVTASDLRNLLTVEIWETYICAQWNRYHKNGIDSMTRNNRPIRAVPTFDFP